MKIPHPQHLSKQNFSSDEHEFVWVFHTKSGAHQFIFGVNKDSLCYIESGKVSMLDEYIEDPFWEENITVERLIEASLWSATKLPPDYNNFSNGNEMIRLVVDCVEYLNNKMTL